MMLKLMRYKVLLNYLTLQVVKHFLILEQLPQVQLMQEAILLIIYLESAFPMELALLQIIHSQVGRIVLQ